MVTVDQMMIKDIPAGAVPYVLPICEIHQAITRVVKTKRSNEEHARTLRVMRFCRCDECYRQGIGDIAVVNHRVFPT